MAAATLTSPVSKYFPLVDVFNAFENAGVDDIDSIDFAVRYLVGCPVTVTVPVEICRRVDFVRRGVEDYEYVGTGHFDEEETSGVITGFNLDERGFVTDVLIDPETRHDARVIDGDLFEDLYVAYNPFAAWTLS